MAEATARAEQDLASGQLVLREPPIPAPAWWGPYHQMLKDRCGVAVVVVSHPGASPALSAADRAYNTVMTAAIEKKHGAGIVGRLQQQAQQDWEAKVKGQARPSGS